MLELKTINFLCLAVSGGVHIVNMHEPTGSNSSDGGASFLGRALHPAGPGPPTRPWCQLCELVMAAEITLGNAPRESVKKLVEEMTLLIIDCYCMYNVWFCAEYLLH